MTPLRSLLAVALAVVLMAACGAAFAQSSEWCGTAPPMADQETKTLAEFSCSEPGFGAVVEALWTHYDSEGEPTGNSGTVQAPGTVVCAAAAPTPGGYCNVDLMAVAGGAEEPTEADYTEAAAWYVGALLIGWVLGFGCGYVHTTIVKVAEQVG